MPAFCTGSRVYGTVHDKSDIDLVVFVDDEQTYKLLKSQSDEVQRNHGEHQGSDFDNGASLRFGRLNLIVCFKDSTRYNSFDLGTDILKQFAPVTRAQAVDLLSHIRSQWKGLDVSDDDAGFDRDRFTQYALQKIGPKRDA